MAKARRPADELFRSDGRIRLEVFSDRAARALRAAIDYARTTGWDALRSPHVFMGLLAEADPAIRNWAALAGLPLQETLARFQQMFTEEPLGEDEPPLALHREFLSDNLIRLLRKARLRAARHRRSRIGTLDLLHAILSTRISVVAECFRRTGHSPEKLARLAASLEDGGG